ncbi:DUF2284 domain-containing protein [Anaeromicropila populeti]|uniref:Predicted metal-binding protein n=1 Tax=Anaeromicropila populeti TaxID=37658 RepID=A0A1I6L0F3_9FIRM|nr:DUF2284 domain-containing protein [Anaeromicropila populeti]SFR96953.1 Predicted metal-binding protein [Anaeromicropila populeti]
MSVPYFKLSQDEVNQKIDKLVQYLVDCKMDDVCVINPKELIFDKKVRMKCRYACRVYNTNLRCPPNAPSVEECKEYVHSFEKGIIYRKTAPADHFAGEDAKKDYKWTKVSKFIQDTSAELESMAFYEGFYLAMAFGAGRCRQCVDIGGKCQGLADGVCRHQLESRPSLEGIGVDLIRSISNLNWNFSIIGKRSEIADIEIAGYIGFIALY